MARPDQPRDEIHPSISQKLWRYIEQPIHSQIVSHRDIDHAPIVPRGARVLRPVDDDSLSLSDWLEDGEGVREDREIRGRLDDARAYVAKRLPRGSGSSEDDRPVHPIPERKMSLYEWRRPGVRQETKVKRYKMHGKF